MRRDVLAEARSPESPDLVIRYLRAPAKNAHVAVCLDCETIVGGVPGQLLTISPYWPASTSAWLHKNGTGHKNVHTAVISVEREVVA